MVADFKPVTTSRQREWEVVSNPTHLSKSNQSGWEVVIESKPATTSRQTQWEVVGRPDKWKQSKWEVDEQRQQSMYVDFNWPLTNLRGPILVESEPQEIEVPKWPKPTVFWQCSRVYGDPVQTG